MDLEIEELLFLCGDWTPSSLPFLVDDVARHYGIETHRANEIVEELLRRGHLYKDENGRINLA
jgi:hypothetical protein